MTDEKTEMAIRVNRLVRGMIEAAMSDESVWTEIDEIIEKDLKQSEATIYFMSKEPFISVRVGSADAANYLETPLKLDDIKWQADDIDAEDIEARIDNVNELILNLAAFRDALLARRGK